MVGENGGGAFVLMYTLFALVLGLPLLTGELVIGKKFRKSVIGATKEIIIGKINLVWIGYAAVILTLVILSYYAVISGWVLHYLAQFLKNIIQTNNFKTADQMHLLLSNPWLQCGMTSSHLLIAMIVVFRGLENGFEKFISLVMPLFVVFVGILAFKSLSLPNRDEALRFLFYPNFSQLTWSSPIQAIGHMCFTLSVGFGSMVTFGSYLRDKDELADASLRVTLTDTLISLFAGLLIFPIVLSASNISLNEPSLLFKAVPQFFIGLDGGMFFGLLFFLCLYLAALGSSIGLFEMIVSNAQEKFKLSRPAAVWLTGGCAFILSLVPTLLTKAEFHNFSLQSFDNLLINWLLPLTALGLGLAVGWGVDKNEIKKYFVVDTRIETVTLFPYWLFFIRWVVPGVFILAIIAANL